MTAGPAKILIVDDSRIVRATLIKAIRGDYAVVEESDGEAGWARIDADAALRVVISDLTMPKLDGYGLLQRIRQSSVARIRTLPVLLLSGDEDEASRARAKSLGATDFITKGIGTAELLARLASAVQLAEQQTALAARSDVAVSDPDSGLFTRHYLEIQTAKILAQATRHGAPVSVLVIGLDGIAEICATFGEAIAGEVARRFGQLLKARIRHEDSLGHFGDTAFAIVSPATPAMGAEVFARRMREAVEAANMSVEGKRLPLTVSIGTASCPPDGAATAEAILALALERMQRATAQGGNRVVGGAAGAATAPPVPSLEHALRLIQAGRGEEIRQHAATLALQVMPLLALADRTCELDLAVDQLASILRERTQQTPDPSS